MSRIRNYINLDMDILFFSILIFVKLMSLNYELKSPRGEAASLILGCLGSVFLLTAIVYLFNEGRRIILLLTFNIAISLILLIDIIYNRYFFDITSIALIGQTKLALEVKESVLALLRPRDFIYFLDIILFLPLWKLYRNRHAPLKGKNFFKRTFLSFSFLIIGFLLSYGSVKVLDKGQPGILGSLYDKKYVAASIGDLNFHFFDAYKYASTNMEHRNSLSTPEKERIINWFEQKNKINTSNYYKSMDGKNLIIVQLESLQGFFLNRIINAQEITPNLNKLAGESLVFNNCYCQTAGGGTSDAELLSNTSLFPAPVGAAYYLYSSNVYDSLAGELKEKGYFTSVMHANRPGFWNRYAMYKSLGFDTFEDESKYKIDDIQGLGLSDVSFYKQSIEKIKKYPKPFYSFLISLSSHFPYKDSRNKIKNILKVGKYEGTLLGDYLKAIRYSDEAIGTLVEEIKSAGLWENSVIVFYGDHWGIPYKRKQELAKLIYNKEDVTALEWFKEQRVISMMHFPNEYLKGINNIPSGQIDLSPTLANLFGFKMQYALGTDLLNSKKCFFTNQSNAWTDGKAVYLSNPDEVVDIKSGSKLNKNDYKEQFKKALELRKMSDLILENNLLKELK